MLGKTPKKHEDAGHIVPADFNKYNSPIAQSSLWGAPPLYDWQEAVLASCWEAGAQVACRTANGSGKSGIVIPLLAASFASAFHGAQVVITSASERQLKKQMEPNLKNYFLNREGWKVTSNQIESPSVDGFPPSNITWFATKSGELFEGFHVKHFQKDGKLYELPLLIIIDEGKSVKHDIYTAVERCDPTVQLAISTVGEDTGDFYDACINKSGLWTTNTEWNGKTIEFKIPWTMCPHLLRGHSYDRKKAMLESRGVNDPDVCSILLAEFFRGGTHMVFEEYDLSAIREAMSGVRQHVRAVRKGFCDFSGGGDEMTLGILDGNRIMPIEAWRPDPTESPDKIADKYIKLYQHYGLTPENIYADNGGLGVMIINEIHAKGWNINRVQPNCAPVYKEGYVDAYTEMHWQVKEMIHKGSLILPKDDILLEQCRLRRYIRSNSDNNKMRMEPKTNAKKSRREHSPDRLDTVAHLCAHAKIVDVKSALTQSTICPTVTEYMEMVRKEREDAENGETGFMSDW